MSKVQLQKIRKYRERLFGEYLVLKNALAFGLIFTSFAVLVPLLKYANTTVTVVIILLGLIIAVLGIALIFEFILKTTRMQLDSKLKRFSTILSANALLGLVFPLMLLNYVFAQIMKGLYQLPQYDTIWCELRNELISIYYKNGVYSQISDLIFILIVVIIITFFAGAILEQHLRRK